MTRRSQYFFFLRLITYNNAAKMTTKIPQTCAVTLQQALPVLVLFQSCPEPLSSPAAPLGSCKRTHPPWRSAKQSHTVQISTYTIMFMARALARFNTTSVDAEPQSPPCTMLSYYAGGRRQGVTVESPGRYVKMLPAT